MGQRVAKSALKASTKQTLANVERAVASRRPQSLTQEQIERLPTSHTIRASEALREDKEYQLQASKDQEYNDNLVKNIVCLNHLRLYNEQWGYSFLNSLIIYHLIN